LYTCDFPSAVRAVPAAATVVDSGSLALKRSHPLSDLLRGMERATEAVVSAITAHAKPSNRESLLKAHVLSFSRRWYSDM